MAPLHFVRYVFRRDLNLLLACHTFAKLKTLALGEWCMTHDLSALIRFLQQSPILEKLTIKIPEVLYIVDKIGACY